MKRSHLDLNWSLNNGPIFAGFQQVSNGYHVVRNHGTDDWHLLLTTRGQGVFYNPERNLTLTTGTAVLMPPGTKHDYAVDGDYWDSVWIHFLVKPEWVDLLKWPVYADKLMLLQFNDSPLSEKITTGIEHIAKIVSEPLVHRQEFMANILENVLLNCALYNPLSRQKKTDDRVEAVILFMLQHLGEDLSLSRLSSAGCMSDTGLCHLFSRQIGVSPMKYLETLRMDRAQILLETTDEPINKIAATLGYEFHYFSLLFKKHTTRSPRAYRQQLQSECF